ncbi:MAG: hypothetical protein DRN40_01300 [Thermoplasmata archaeon]|nr:MAG: hypothetical protein DRN40_01300 [Thermoplasmata archaeon]
MEGRSTRGAWRVREYCPPRRRPPWIVSYIFGGYGGKKICSEGLLATLLDMKRKGLIRIEGGKIYVLSDYTTDPFERRVLDFLRRHSGKDGLELTKIKGALTTGADAELKEDLLRLLKADGEILEYKEEFLEDYVPWAQYSYIVPSLTILMILFILVFFYVQLPELHRVGPCVLRTGALSTSH